MVLNQLGPDNPIELEQDAKAATHTDEADMQVLQELPGCRCSFVQD